MFVLLPLLPHNIAQGITNARIWDYLRDVALNIHSWVKYDVYYEGCLWCCIAWLRVVYFVFYVGRRCR